MTDSLAVGLLGKLLYSIPRDQHNPQRIKELLTSHPEVKFVSLVGIDLKGNDTDEKIPVEVMLEDIEKFLEDGIQTDGSSVVLHNIATLNDAKVIIKPDTNVNWYVDYNFDFLKNDDKMPVGTLRIPSFLVHNDKLVCSRSILIKAMDSFKSRLLEVLKNKPYALNEVGIKSFNDIEDIVFTSATELEFWVQTPEDKADEEKLSTSQTLKEQYWKKTEGTVRTALEKTLILMGRYGFEPEMGHKEVGGVRSKINMFGKQNHIMEQLEIDWKYSDSLQAADNELFIRSLITDVYHSHGLEVTFLAKPIEGVAGSGEHTHIGIAAKLKSGKRVNLFSMKNMRDEYTSAIGFASLLGILRNYEVINPFVTSTNDAFNRLKPGFEAPVCIVSSLGQSVEIPSRNRSILIGLIRDLDNPYATRFELRAPNPHSNTYLVISSCYQCMIDGIEILISAGKTAHDLEKEFSKKAGDDSLYLDKDREYRSEEDVFEHFTEEERNRLFGTPPATVWENIQAFDLYPQKTSILKKDDVFTDAIIESYKLGTIDYWLNELKSRIIEDNMELVRSCQKVHNNTDDISDLDIVNWTKVNNLRWHLMKDSVETKSMFSMIKDAIDENDFDEISRLQLEMAVMVKELKELYLSYKKNIF